MVKIPRSYKLPLVIIFFELVGIWVLFRSGYLRNGFILNYYKSIPYVEDLIDNKEVEINAVIKDYTSKIPGDYAVYIKDLNNSKTYTFDEQKVFNSASLYKLAILYKVYEDLDSGEINKDDLLSADKQTLDEQLSAASEEEADQTSGSSEGGVISYTVDYAARLMIRVSDNYAALLLADEVGWGNAQRSLEKIKILGFDLTGENAPSVNADAVGQLLEKIYKKEAVSKQASAQMIDILADQRINDRIPKLLAGDIKVAHKTGEFDGIRHDAGIVFGRRQDYIFVFLSQTGDPVETSNNMAVASKEIFDILEN